MHSTGRNTLKNIAIFLIIVIAMVSIFENSYAKTSRKTPHTSSIETTPPNFTPLYTNNIETRKEKLPESDKNAREYIVIPSKGVVLPIVTIDASSNDYWRVRKGNSINVNKYLQNGALKYPFTARADYGDIGNTVIIGHSSYFKRDKGRYKTHFQSIIGLEAGKEVWIFSQKPDSEEYEKYTYKVRFSFETTPKDSSVLEATAESMLTLITCTPIGGIRGRWIVQAVFSHVGYPKTFGDVSGILAKKLKKLRS